LLAERICAEGRWKELEDKVANAEMAQHSPDAPKTPLSEVDAWKRELQVAREECDLLDKKLRTIEQELNNPTFGLQSG